MTPPVHRIVGVAAVAVTAAAVGWGLWTVGSPENRRLEKLDERRLDDLRGIAREMRGLVYDAGDERLERPLFDDLASLAAAARNRRVTIEDPVTGEPYAYRVLDTHRYELCATFARPRDADFEVSWNHPAGRHCFVIDVREWP